LVAWLAPPDESPAAAKAAAISLLLTCIAFSSSLCLYFGEQTLMRAAGFFRFGAGSCEDNSLFTNVNERVEEMFRIF
jgi:hypothetical protein